MEKCSPELGFGTDLIGGPELHTVDLGMLIFFRWEGSSYHLVLMKLFTQSKTHHSMLPKSMFAENMKLNTD